MRKYSIVKTSFMIFLISLLVLSGSRFYVNGVGGSSLESTRSVHGPWRSRRFMDQDRGRYAKPIIYHPDLIDRDLDKVQDSLENVVSQAIVENGNALIPVIVTLYDLVSDLDLNYFRMLGGHVTHVYRYITYGFAGSIPADQILTFAEFEGEKLVVIERDVPLRYHLDFSVPLVRARPLVWQTHGYLGSPNSSIAIIDTGIDDSHPDVGPYGNLNFSRKIIGWYDATGDGASTPQDYGEHGTHVAGIAAGTGAANTLQGSGEVETTFTYILPPEEPGPWVYGYVDYIDVTSPGVIKLQCSWGGSNNVLLVLSDPAGDEVKRTSGTSQPLILTYNTAGTSYPTGRYEVFVGNVDGPSGTPFSCVETYPYQGLDDGYNLFTGVAPNSKLVGVKVFDNTGTGTLSALIAGMDWIVENRMTYHIVVASMSLGLEDGAVDTTLDQKADTLVMNGIVTTVSAGNDYPDYTIASPGTAAYVLTVAATNDQNGITSYSSNGETSKNEFGLVKPDVAAPGGTFQPAYGNQIVSADSNDVDSAYSGFADHNENDYQQMAGTSMAAPHVAGLAALLTEALGNWSWTFEEALKVKMIIGMTSFETQSGEETNVPMLDRGGKDSKEGYGRISAEAAIEAVTMSYSIGESAVDAFGAAPMDKKVWARRVWLSADTTYEFNLSVPSGADYDLYLYDSSPDAYGQPVILERSVNASIGGGESFRYTPDSSDTFYIVIKLVGGSGAFNLTSIIVEHDVAVVKVAPSTAKAYEGEVININVTVNNEGTVKETFNVTAYYNETILGTARVTSLAPGANTTLTFVWNTSNVSPGYYVISAMAESIPNETDFSDNSVTDGVVRVKIPGDVDGDGDVDVDDLILVTWALGTDPSWPHGVGWDMWNPECDFNVDDRVDAFDLFMACRHYGMTES